MIKIFIAIVWFLIFSKLFVFWLWLWQLKEYHLGRFRAHFETQRLRKIVFSFYGKRFPKLTGKTIVVLVSGTLINFLILFYLFSFSGYLFYLSLLFLIFLAPIIFSFLVLFFQIPTITLKKRILKKAKKKIEKFSVHGGLVIGVSGSYGKTSTKEFLAAILSKKFKVLKTRKHINAEIGIAQTVLNELNPVRDSEDRDKLKKEGISNGVKPEHQIFIAEIGAYERGKIKEVCRMLQPKIGILTGINEQHISTFGSQENIIKAKFELIDNLPENGIAIFNWDNRFIKSKIHSAENGTKIQKFCSVEEKKDIWAENIRVEKEFIYFKVKSKKGDSADFKVNLLGRQNIENILLAAACAEELGMDLDKISSACLEIKEEQGGMKFVKKEDPAIIDSSYSANPAGVIADLDYLKVYFGKKIIIMPCLIELGKSAKEIHKEIGKKIGEICDLAVITTKDYFEKIKEGALEAGMKEEKIILREKKEDINYEVKEFSNQDDVLLLEGRAPNGLIALLRDKKD